MRTWTGLKAAKTGQGFTLVELLLSVTLLVLLAGAVVFNFSNLHRGAALEEGATQMQGLLRFARGYASNSGKLVQLKVGLGLGMESSSNAAPMQLVCENNPLRNPGYFEAVAQADPYVRQILDLVNVEQVRIGENIPAGFSSADVGVATNMPSLQLPISEESTNAPSEFTAITFYPDGTSDSAEVVLSSKDQEDTRKISLRLTGFLGTIRRSYVAADGVEGVETNGATSMTSTNGGMP